MLSLSAGTSGRIPRGVAVGRMTSARLDEGGERALARRHALNAETLAALGAERLATLLMDLAEGDTAVRKRLVLAAAEAGGEDALTKALDRRLSALASSRGYIAWEKARAYAAELDGLRAALAENRRGGTAVQVHSYGAPRF